MRIIGVSVLALALMASLTVAMTSQQGTNPEDTATVVGLVTRAGTNEPLTDVQVSLEGAVSEETMQRLLRETANAGIAINPPPGASLSETTQLLISTAAARGLPIQAPGIQNLVTRAVGEQKWPTTSTDRDGKFTFTGVKPGRFTVRAQREGFFGRPVNGTYPPTAWTDIVVAGKETTEAPLSLAQGAIIGGRVYDMSGAPLLNAQVQVYSVAYQTGFALLQPGIPGAAKTTDDRGEFRLFWVPPGQYYLGAAPAARAGGPGAAFQLGARTFYPNVTRMNDALPISIRGGEDLRLDISMREAPLFRISGSVTNTIPLAVNAAGDGLQPATIFFHLANRDLETPNDATTANNSGNISLAVTKGTFELTNVPPGSYEVLARVADPNAGAGLGAFAWGRAIVDVENRDVRDVAITINPAVSVKGTVKVAGAGGLPPNLRVALTPMGGSSRVALYTLLSARASAVGADGSYSVASVPPGRFRIGAVSGLPQDYYIADVLQGATSVFDSGFDVESQVPNPVEILISSGAGVADGVVQDANGKPLAGATVALIPESNRFQNRALFANATSDASGRFVFRGIAPGDYRVMAWESTPPNAYQNAAFIKRYDDRGKSIRMVPRGVVHTEVVVIPAIEQR